MNLNNEPVAWHSTISLSLEMMETRLIYFCQPDPQRKSWLREWKRDRNWLNTFLTGISSAEYSLKISSRLGVEAGEYSDRLNKIIREAKDCVDENLEWVKNRFDIDLTKLVDQYCSMYWVEAIRDGLPYEMGYVLSRRDDIEAYFNAHNVLHPQLSAKAELVERVKLADGILRSVGAELWLIDPPIQFGREERSSIIPIEHWWWLDQQQ